MNNLELTKKASYLMKKIMWQARQDYPGTGGLQLPTGDSEDIETSDTWSEGPEIDWVSSPNGVPVFESSGFYTFSYSGYNCGIILQEHTSNMVLVMIDGDRNIIPILTFGLHSRVYEILDWSCGISRFLQ